MLVRFGNLDVWQLYTAKGVISRIQTAVEEGLDQCSVAFRQNVRGLQWCDKLLVVICTLKGSSFR